MSLAVAKVSRRRTNQLCDLVRMLEFGAIDLDAGPGIAEQSFGHGLDDPGLSRARGPQKQQIANRTSRRIQPRQEHLVDFHHLLNRSVLAHDFAAQGVVEISGIVTAAGGIENCIRSVFHRVGGASLSWAVRLDVARYVPASRSDKFCHSRAVCRYPSLTATSPSANRLAIPSELPAAYSFTT